jgi:transaldolase
MAAHGQSPWLDDISDELIASGRLGRMIEEEGLRGLTSNPSIFEKAINSGKGRYPADLARLKAQGADAQTAYERLTMEDIAAAADALLPVYDRTGGDDGFVSLEVLPSLAYEEEKSVAEATRLFAELGRPNVMIKVPGTDEGIRAFKRLTAAGVNINVTLIFSRVFYGRIARAYVAGLRERIAAGEDATGVRSVASVFVSRIDTLIDKRLEEMRAAEKDPARREKIDSILHRVAIANTKLIYQDFKSIFMGEEFADLAEAGAAVQRPLWGSTSAKNPDLPDTLYAEELIGAHTVNTLPAATLEAMIDRGRVRGATIEEDVAGARATMKTLAELGIDIEEACMKLQKDGVKSFADAFDKLFAAIQKALGK